MCWIHHLLFFGLLSALHQVRIGNPSRFSKNVRILLTYFSRDLYTFKIRICDIGLIVSSSNSQIISSPFVWMVRDSENDILVNVLLTFLFTLFPLRNRCLFDVSLSYHRLINDKNLKIIQTIPWYRLVSIGRIFWCFWITALVLYQRCGKKRHRKMLQWKKWTVQHWLRSLLPNTI